MASNQIFLYYVFIRVLYQIVPNFVEHFEGRDYAILTHVCLPISFSFQWNDFRVVNTQQI